MKDSTNKNPIIEDIEDWWEFLDTSEKVSVIWLAVVALIVLVLGIMFPIFGIIALGSASIVGTFAALFNIFG
jgi:hypothetical protein